MSGSTCTIKTLGLKAAEQFSRPGSGKVLGTTSAGVFLGIDREEEIDVMFLTTQAERGPLTANLDYRREGWPPSLLSPGDPVLIGKSGISLQAHYCCYGMQTAAIWQPASRPEGYLPGDDRMGLLSEVVRCANINPKRNPVASLLGGPSDSKDANSIQWHYQKIQDLLRERVSDGLTEHAAHFLGWGSGLTPAGDDLLVGLLLALKRYGDILLPDFHPTAFNTQVSQAARKKTTALSAGLIGAAADGQADERLITAIDDLVAGTSDAEQITRTLLGFGSSSGLDTLAGFGLVIRAATS